MRGLVIILNLDGTNVNVNHQCRASPMNLPAIPPSSTSAKTYINLEIWFLKQAKAERE